MAYQPYDPCPCGSGKKLKWCCQKIVKYAERATQLLESDQVAAALQAIDEGLAIEPANLWLRTMKIEVLLGQHQHEAAAAVIQSVLDTRPGYLPVLYLRLQDELAHRDVAAALPTMQEILDGTAKNDDQAAAYLALCGRVLAMAGWVFAALAHLRVAVRSETLRDSVERELERLEQDGSHVPWLRDEWPLRAAPASEGTSQRWGNAVELAGSGRWRRALALFESIVADRADSAELWFNIGICRASLHQPEAAAQALERYVELEPDRAAALHAMALAQAIHPRESTQTVDVVQIRHAIRDHSLLIQRLRDHRRFFPRALDAEEEAEEGIKSEFFLCSKEWREIDENTSVDDLPLMDGVVRVREGVVELDFADPAADDDRPRVLLEAAGNAIDPDGARSVIDTLALSSYRSQRGWVLPGRGSPEVSRRIRRGMNHATIMVTWPDVPHGWLDDRTPREAAAMPGDKLKLRAAVLLVESAAESGFAAIDGDALRAKLGLEPEPGFSGDGVEIERLPLAQLKRIRVDGLSIAQLDALFERAIRFELVRAGCNAAEALAAREFKGSRILPERAFSTLIEVHRADADRSGAEMWLERARRFDADAGNAPSFAWDLAQWRISCTFDAPEIWVSAIPELMSRTATDRAANQALTLELVERGLIRLMPHPSDPNKVFADGRLLEAMIARYGTRHPGAVDLTPVGGQPGKLWTPDSERRGGGSAIVLPGEVAPPRGGSKLVLPGS